MSEKPLSRLLLLLRLSKEALRWLGLTLAKETTLRLLSRLSEETTCRLSGLLPEKTALGLRRVLSEKASRCGLLCSNPAKWSHLLRSELGLRLLSK